MEAINPLICQNCGGYIDRKTLRCPYCDAQYFIIPKPLSYVSRSEADSLDAYIEKMKREKEKLEKELAVEKMRQAYVKAKLFRFGME